MDAQRLIADRYSLVEPMPGSATGLSWRATDQWSGQPVVITRVPVSSLQGDELLRARQEIAREVRVLGGLRNDHLARPVDVVLEAGDLWVASELLPGVTMAAELARRGMVGPPEGARWGRDVADGLAAAHGAGAPHRDLHAGVVGIALDGRAVLGGFATTVVTPEGLRGGVPVHVAPEVARGAPPSPASDIFALGVLLYRTMEGQEPFSSATDRDRLLAAMREGAVAAPPRAGLLRDPLMRMLDPDPARRPTALAVADQLKKLCAAPSAVQPAIAWLAAPERSASRVTPGAGPSASAPVVPGSGPAAPASYGGPPPWVAPPTEPVIPEQRGSGWSPPAGDPGTPARHRNRMWWVVVAAIVAVLAIAGGLLAALRPPWTAALPGLPPAAPPPPPGPIGDPRTADPCSLLTVGSVARFGSATPVPDLGYPQSCAIVVQMGAEAVVLRATFDVAPDREPIGIAERIGDMRIYRYAASKGTCQRTVVFKNLSQVFVRAWVDQGAATDLCAIADAGTQTAVAALSSASLARRDLGAPAGALTGLDTCSLLDQAVLAQVPGLDATRRRQGFAGWLCLWGQNPAFVTTPMVKVAVNRTVPLSSQPVLISGRSGQVLPGGKDDPGSCEVDLVQRSYTGSSGRPRVELLEITVSLGAQQSTDVACRSARALAEAAAPKLPPAS